MTAPVPEHEAPLAPSVFERVRTALGALRVLMRDHDRLDQVLVMAQAVNAGVIKRAVLRLEAIEGGKELMEEQPRIDRTHVDFDALRRLPDGTLGREYVRFLDDNKIGPDVFEKLPERVDPRSAYVMLRFRQTHDLWHVLTGYQPDVRGELLLQAFTFAQMRAPSALLIALFGTLRYRPSLAHLKDLRHAYQRGKATALLATFRWESHWDTSVADLREKLRVPAV